MFSNPRVPSLVWQPWSDSQASWQKDLQQHGQGVFGEEEEGPERLFAGGSDQDGGGILGCAGSGVLRAECVLQLLLNPEMVKACPVLIPYVYDFLENKAYSKGKGDFARKVKDTAYTKCLIWSVKEFHVLQGGRCSLSNYILG